MRLMEGDGLYGGLSAGFGETTNQAPQSRPVWSSLFWAIDGVMKSSIFDAKDPVKRKPAKLRGHLARLSPSAPLQVAPGPSSVAARSLGRKAHSASPHLAGSSFASRPVPLSHTASATAITSALLSSIPKFKKTARLDAAVGASAASWNNIDDFIALHQETGALPPPLSPSIPKTFSVDDDVSLSMLSPTLPAIFDNGYIALPLPKRPKQPVSVASDASEYDGKVRTRKNTGPHSAFYVEISFSTPYKKALAQALKPTARPMAGLGISVKEKPLDADAGRHSNDQEVAKLNRKNYWAQLAKEASHKWRTHEDPRVAAVVGVDSILLYMIAYEYDDSLHATDMVTGERNWHKLVHNCTEVIASLEGAGCEFQGVLHLTQAMILKKVNSILQAQILQCRSQPDSDINHIVQLQDRALRNWQLIEERFRLAAQSGPMLQHFPKTWVNRLPAIPSPPDSDSAANFVPSRQGNYLPLGIYSDLREVAGVLFSCARETIDSLSTRPVYHMKSASKKED